MSSAEKVRELAAKGYWASAIAEELKISRQRVYQIAKANEIEMPMNRASLDRPNRRPPTPRIQTGGVMAKVNHSVAGTISELLVAADLMARGWQVFMPVIASKGHDLIAMKDGRLVTFEVRSAYRSAAGKVKYAKQAGCTSDHYGLVVTGEPVTYDPPIDEPPPR